MEKGQKRNSYSKEFKVEAVKLVESIGICKASEELGVNQGSLRNWTAKKSLTPSNEPGKPTYGDLEKEVRRLRKELGYMETINSVLKKSTAIFSQSHLDDLK